MREGMNVRGLRIASNDERGIAATTEIGSDCVEESTRQAILSRLTCSGHAESSRDRTRGRIDETGAKRHAMIGLRASERRRTFDSIQPYAITRIRYGHRPRAAEVAREAHVAREGATKEICIQCEHHARTSEVIP
jgi:hypothetical protein